MQPQLPLTGRRWAVDMYLASVGLLTLALTLLSPRISRSWVIADWLINYQGGFVRRGLPGEIAYLLARPLHLSPVVFPVFYCVCLYLILLGAARSLILHASRSWWVYALLLSPATFSFQVLDIGAGSRKELIYLAALALLLLLLARRPLSGVAVSIVLSVAMVVGVLSHEGLVFYTPYLFAALVCAGRTIPQAARLWAAPAALSLVAAALCSHYIGNAATASSICSSLGQKLLLVEPQNQICSGGAIAYLAVTRSGALAQARFIEHANHYVALYGILTALALIPIAMGSRALWRAGFRSQLRVVWVAAGFSMLGSLILFVYAIDWGRWIYIHILSLALLLLFLDQKRLAALPPYNEATATGHTPVAHAPVRLAVVGWLALAAYATLWTLPHAYYPGPLFGYIDLSRQLAARVQHHTASDTTAVTGGQPSAPSALPALHP